MIDCFFIDVVVLFFHAYRRSAMCMSQVHPDEYIFAFSRATNKQRFLAITVTQIAYNDHLV